MFYNKWDLWWAYVPLEENKNELLHRPVLVMKDTNDSSNKEIYILSYKVTSHVPRNGYLGELEILDYKDAGLPMKSTLRLSKKLLLPSKLFDEKIGRLSEKDQIRVENELINMNNNKYSAIKQQEEEPPCL
ncbi:MAG: hypothetical protein IJ593_00070 [Lachnospiraceae bacterium]|nr:hypothetical protein [Lachnospiraceae bacterium]